MYNDANIGKRALAQVCRYYLVVLFTGVIL